MDVPEGAKPTVYESVFVLEKNGEKKEFSLENYPIVPGNSLKHGPL